MSKHSVLAAAATIREMLADRGLDTGDFGGIGEEEVGALVASLDIFSIESPDKVVIFILKKLKNSELVKAAELIEASRRGATIIVAKDRMSGVNMECARTNFGRTVESFTLDELAVNISRHVNVPRHELLPDGELAPLLKRYKLKSPAQLPVILRSDPMARYIGARPGNVVKIDRKSLTAGNKMRVGDVRKAMALLDTPGSKEVVAQLPDDDDLIVTPTVFRPLLSVARTEGNSGLLDDLSENVLIGRNKARNLEFALMALVESKPSSINTDELKTLAGRIYARSFYHRVMAAQRKAAPNVLFYLVVAACLYLLPMLLKEGARCGIEYYALLQDTDVAVAHAARARRAEFKATFGAMRTRMDGVRSRHDTGQARGEESAAHTDLLPGPHDDSLVHMLKLLSRVGKKDLERYSRADLDALDKYVEANEVNNTSIDASIDGPTRMVMMLLDLQDGLLAPLSALTQWCGRTLVAIVAVYYALTIAKAGVDTVTDIYQLSLLRQVYCGVLVVVAVTAVCSGALGGKVSVTIGAALSVAALSVWQGGQFFVPST